MKGLLVASFRLTRRLTNQGFSICMPNLVAFSRVEIILIYYLIENRIFLQKYCHNPVFLTLFSIKQSVRFHFHSRIPHSKKGKESDGRIPNKEKIVDKTRISCMVYPIKARLNKNQANLKNR